VGRKLGGVGSRLSLKKRMHLEFLIQYSIYTFKFLFLPRSLRVLSSIGLIPEDKAFIMTRFVDMMEFTFVSFKFGKKNCAFRDLGPKVFLAKI